uniref:Putative secreted protein n=1 Tax=Anopheles darlingi TaxID=43151 RepID=A0A2M4DFB8_ANODA
MPSCCHSSSRLSIVISMATRSCTVAAILFCVVTVLQGATQALECYSCSGEDCAKVATVGATTVCPNTDDVCYSRFDATNRKL